MHENCDKHELSNRTKYAYDDDGEITGIDNGAATYTYSAAGSRVRKDSGSAWTEYIDFGGLTVAEKNSDGSWNDYIFANGTRIAQASSANALTPASSTTYYHGDQIRSTRMVTNGSGGIISMNEFYPYGEGAQPTTQNHYLFSGKERDLESGLDYFGARYYAAIVGRFMSADWSAQVEPVPYAKLEEPQSLNLYAFVRNNPVSIIDPDGHEPNDGYVLRQQYHPDPEGLSGMGSNELVIAAAAEKERKEARKQGTGFWRGLNNLIHLHSWNYVKATVTATQTDQFGNVLLGAGAGAPMANPAAVFAKYAAKPVGPATAPPSLIPALEPPITPPPPTLEQRLLQIATDALDLAGDVKSIIRSPIICISCGTQEFKKHLYQDGAPDEIY